ncbi:hypothetical protein [Niabella hibiscisoli]|uniref:hypothetical protein n=1 Tax=Niabella hibiscisoli TaxID=1825928 RepID=UPI001F101FAD|nr:hypothetical protein [Niabella hibiscisoli]MCH5721340.1 hypothetical protein [Niabella hibiscisoli]
MFVEKKLLAGTRKPAGSYEIKRPAFHLTFVSSLNKWIIKEFAMQIVQQIVFALLAVFALLLFSRKALQIRRNINLGREEEINDNKAQRWNNVLLLALGQKKMFRNPLVGVLHFLCMQVLLLSILRFWKLCWMAC